MTAEELWQFWADARRELEHTPIDADVEPVESSLDPLVSVQRVTLASLGGAPSRAYWLVPYLGGAAGPLPAVLCTPG
ncbi:MAG: hypothetical protein AB7Y46_03965 [Armatimonadota bacterium]